MMKKVLLSVAFWLTFIWANGQIILTLQPGPDEGKDTYVNSVIPDEPGGLKPELVACGWTFGGEFGIGRYLLRFDLSQIPAGAQIQSAKLTLYFSDGSTFGSQTGANASYLEKVTQDWDEATTTWNTMPSSTTVGEVFIPQTTLPTQDLTDIDITAFVSGWVSNPSTNFGMLHHLISEVTYNCLIFKSSDYTIPAKRPKLVVTYTCDLPAPHFTYSTNNQMVTFTESSLQPLSWYWDFGDGNFSILKNPQHYYTAPGTYYVCEKATNACTAETWCDSVNVFASSVGGNPDIMSPSVFPNPAQENVIVTFDAMKKGVMILDLYNPQAVKKFTFTREVIPGENRIPLYLPGLPSGLYLLRINSGDYERMIKLIIQ